MLRGHHRPSFRFVHTKSDRTHRCSVESSASPATRKGIPGMIGKIIPAMPSRTQTHPTTSRKKRLFATSFRQKFPLGSECVSAGPTQFLPSRPESDALKEFTSSAPPRFSNRPFS
jgi:hypothetical protein